MKYEYKADRCNSDFEPIADLAKIKELIKSFVNAFAVAWYFDEIVFYSIDNSTWNKPMKGFDELVRLRIFDKDKEIHVWLSNGQLKGRFRTDGKGSEIQYTDARLILNGTSFELMNQGVVATEDKGTRYELPYPAFEILAGKKNRVTKNRVAILTRNYIDHNEIGQAGFVDCRFVDFEIF
jgi:CRISPR-associated protein (TIGR03984 family)